MKKTTDVVAQKETSILSWLLRASAATFPQAPILVTLNLARIKALPDVMVREVVSYLPLSERANLFMLTKNKERSIFDEDLHERLAKEQLIDTFIHIMTLKRPGNLRKAEAMLKQYPQLADTLMSIHRKTHGDMAQQFSTPMSAYKYAWWVDDTAMCHLLEHYMDESTKAEVLQQCEESTVSKFMYLMTREGEDNQHKAQAMLIKYPHLVSQLISEQVDTRDLVRHFIKPMSAYEYAYWSGDTRMRTMLKQYIDQDESLKAIVNAQCENIAEHGIEFEMISSHGKPVPNSTVSHSKHFDYQPLQAAYAAYNAETTRLINANKCSNEDWVDAEALWLKVGIEWAKAPVSGMQEICSRHPFHPLQTYQATLTNPSLVRTVKFRNWISDKDEYLVSRGVVNVSLGGSFSIYKGGLGWSGLGVRVCSGGGRHGLVDSLAVAAICKARTDDDLKQTLVDLKPAEPRSRLGL